MPLSDLEFNLKIDLIFSFTEYESQALLKVTKIKINDTFVNFCSVEDLIIHKVFAGRALDLEDVRNIILRNKDIDKNYIIDWLKKFEETNGKDYTGTFNDILKNI